MPPNWGGELELFILCFTRCAVMLSLSPPLSWRHFPMALRLGVAAVLAVPVMLSLSTAAPHVAGGLYALLLLREAAIGAALGLGLYLLVTAGLAAGTLVETGLGLPDDEEGPLATLLLLLIIVFFTQLGGLPWLVGALRESYVLAPVGTRLPELGGWSEMLYWPSRMLATMLALAAPIVLATILASWLVASLQRCLPGLRAEQLAPAARHVAAVLALALVVPLLGAFVLGGMSEAATAATRVLLRIGQ